MKGQTTSIRWNDSSWWLAFQYISLKNNVDWYSNWLRRRRKISRKEMKKKELVEEESLKWQFAWRWTVKRFWAYPCISRRLSMSQIHQHIFYWAKIDDFPMQENVAHPLYPFPRPNKIHIKCWIFHFGFKGLKIYCYIEWLNTLLCGCLICCWGMSNW